MLEKLRQLPRELYILYAGTTITRLGAFVFPYLTIYLSEARGYGVQQVGLILSVGAIGLLIGNFAGGWATDQFSRKWTLIIALCLNAGGFAGLAGVYESGWMYAVFLFVGYVGSGMYTPAANTVIADVAPEHLRPFAYTLNYMCINLGMAIGPLAAGFLAAYSYSWIFIGDVATSLACAALVAFGLPETRKRRGSLAHVRKGLGLSPTVWLRYPIVMMFCLAYFFIIGPLMGLEYAVPLLVKIEFLQPLTFVGAIYTVNAICVLSFSFVVERYLRGRDEMRMMVVAGMFWAVGLLILAVGFSVGALLICTVVWTVGEIIGSILVPSFIARHVAHDCKGRFMALNDIVRSLAGVICPIGLGFLWATQGAQTVVYVILALPVVGMLCYLLMLVLVSPTRRVIAPTLLRAEQ